jgi:hypothetical protein
MKLPARSSLVGAGSVAAPVAAFLFLKAVIGLEPSASPAQTVEPGRGIPGPAAGATAPGAAPLPAHEWVRALRPHADLPSPLEQGEPAPDAAPAPIPAPVDPLAGLRLSALLTGVDGASATINGRVYRAGETVVSGYTLKSIDARGQRVELAGPGGEVRWIDRSR